MILKKALNSTFSKVCLIIMTCLGLIDLSATQIDSICQHNQEEALKGPNWVPNSVIYSIFPRNFSKEGNFTGITQRIDQLKELGVDVLWLMPIHSIGDAKKKGSIGSPYCVQDYERINPAYGTHEDLKKLIQKAHQVGLKVIVDAVLNHTSWDCVLMRHPQFYRKNDSNEIVSPLPEWCDVAALDYTNPELQAYIVGMLKSWLCEWDLDGFRFDASDFIPLDFWKKVRQELHQVKPDILLLGEGEKPEAICTGFDLDYDWKFKNALDSIVMNGAPATETVQALLRTEDEIFPKGALHLRFSDNHDEKRAIARYGEKGALAASVIIFTMNGVPLIYNGMEVGDATESRDPALFEKMPIFWDSAEIRPEFKNFYPKMIALRKKYPAFWRGDFKWLKNSSEERILTYLRSADGETLFVAVNLSNQPFTGTVNLKGTFEDITPRREELNTLLHLFPTLSLGAWEYRIYKMP